MLLVPHHFVYVYCVVLQVGTYPICIAILPLMKGQGVSSLQLLWGEICLSTHVFIYLFNFRNRGREKEREKHQLVVPLIDASIG